MNGQSGFIGFINKTEMVSLSSLGRLVVLIIGSLVFTGVAAWLLTRRATPIAFSMVHSPEEASMAATVFLSQHTAAEAMRQVGLYLAGLLLTVWTGGTIAGIFQNKVVRETSREALEGQAKIAEAEARGKAQGTAAVHAQTVQKVEVQNGGAVISDNGEDEEHEWRDRDYPKGGLG